jgi:8-oxo-dGTP diphosphatase
MSLLPSGFSVRVYGVLRRAGKLLLTRSRFKDKEFVNFPGGAVEPGEPPLSALKRELLEETGLEIKPVRILYVSEAAHVSTHTNLQIVSAYWLIEQVGGALREGGNGDDVISLFWTPEKQIPTEEMFPSDLEFAKRLSVLL